jgi:hypothetical protein
MIWMTLALAATPDNVAAALPEAQAQLEACEDACTPAEGAEAAFVVAVGTYVESGVADGTLAATVELLDPELFTQLPEVLQASVAAPLDWAVALAVPPDAIAGHPVTAVQIDMPTVSGPWPIELTLKVEDPDGEPVPTARFQVVGEGIERSVDATGSFRMGAIWKSTPLAPVDGVSATHIVPTYFQKGESVTLVVTAPGYQRQAAQVLLARNPRRNVFTVVLQPEP